MSIIGFNHSIRFNSSSVSSGASGASASSEIQAQLTSFSDNLPNAAEEAVTLTSNQIGYLQSIGLAESWVWPSHFIQHCLEYVHVYSGLPWWGTIIATTVAMRVILFPLYVKSADIVAKNSKAKPELDPIMKKVMASNDFAEKQRLALQRKHILKKYGIKNRYLAIPVLQLPLALGFFAGLRSMALVPVDGFTTQGAYWFTDLSAPDPYLGLQIISASVFIASMKLGGETGTAQFSPGIKKLMTYLPIVSIPATMYLSSGVVLYFAANAVCAVLQSALLRSEAFRKMVGIEPIPEVVIDPSKANEGILDLAKNFIEDTKKKAEAKALETERLEKAFESQKSRVPKNDVIIKKRFRNQKENN
ncbi:hypothetical protein PACTADRAFT_36940 [Pachysolen tannophilus NRRL Y-2460]|uniref:Membrane insertase YidC/Oxa/ALB C-terminal domain-containing protein n=1 Tax=Pachysolen tannophilus NRRL Y-2460 TaxID=669874 RepID=A0A1E4U2X6_PACTA|nr:hypothetical protein PACTADRAFT_36940 [Pachysolen tannophilus NRRL Y-2460]